MKTDNLKELRELRNQEKAIKARIDEISTEATNEAVAILAEKGLEKGEFEVDGGSHGGGSTYVVGRCLLVYHGAEGVLICGYGFVI